VFLFELLAHASSVDQYRADRNLDQWLRGLLVQINDVFRGLYAIFRSNGAPVAQPGVKVETGRGSRRKPCARFGRGIVDLRG
jgi:hypothetical protein